MAHQHHLRSDLAEFRRTCGHCAKLMCPEVLSTVFLMCRYPGWETRYQAAVRDENPLKSDQVSSVAAAGQAHIRSGTWYTVLMKKMDDCASQQLDRAFSDSKVLTEFQREVCSVAEEANPEESVVRSTTFLSRLYLAIYMPKDSGGCINEITKNFKIAGLSEDTRTAIRIFRQNHPRVDLDAVVKILRASATV